MRYDPRPLICLLLIGTLAACSGNGGDPGTAGKARSAGVPPAAAAPASREAPVAGDAAQAPSGQRQESGQQMAQTCLSCHSVENFAGFSAAELQTAMQSMRAGEMAHMPLPASLSDDDLAAIAAFLTGANEKP
jgi:cytochrome c553